MTSGKYLRSKVVNATFCERSKASPEAALPSKTLFVSVSRVVFRFLPPLSLFVFSSSPRTRLLYLSSKSIPPTPPNSGLFEPSLTQAVSLKGESSRSLFNSRPSSLTCSSAGPTPQYPNAKRFKTQHHRLSILPQPQPGRKRKAGDARFVRVTFHLLSFLVSTSLPPPLHSVQLTHPFCFAFYHQSERQTGKLLGSQRLEVAFAKAECRIEDDPDLFRRLEEEDRLRSRITISAPSSDSI